MQTNTPIPFIRARTSPTEKQILSMVTGLVLLISAAVGGGRGGGGGLVKLNDKENKIVSFSDQILAQNGLCVSITPLGFSAAVFH